ncbi:MAG: site-2 protease family protein [Armatimonadetes bacterium]|nr:site-2 protease family protein [Armatimonadota bacterium]MDW8153073.1 site-2 protease family protein [Armatimonadota bacterium]
MIPSADDLALLVHRHFPVRETWVQDGLPVFAVLPTHDLEERFEALREALRSQGQMPLLRRRDGTVLLTVVPKPHPPLARLWLHAALFLATVATTFATGYIGSLRFAEVLQRVPDAVLRAGYAPEPLRDGFVFSAALLGILLVHELGHKLAARIHGIDASWPYFIPFPPVILGQVSIGTMGAVIVTREPAPSRNALFDLGASGPLAGLLVAIPLLLLGLDRTVLLDLRRILPHLGGLPAFPFPWSVTRLLEWRFGAGAEVVYYTDPLTDAAVIGLFVTGINLLPASMLDGGHAVRALLGPRWHRVASYAAVVLLLLLGLIPMAILLLFLTTRGHPGPANDVSPPSGSRIAVGMLLLVVFLLALPLDYFLLPLRLLQ